MNPRESTPLATTYVPFMLVAQHIYPKHLRRTDEKPGSDRTRYFSGSTSHCRLPLFEAGCPSAEVRKNFLALSQEYYPSLASSGSTVKASTSTSLPTKPAEKLRENVENHMNMLVGSPDRVVKYFRHEQIRYAA